MGEGRYYKISVTGDLGSGKSTVLKIMADKLGAEIVSIGYIQREMAKEMGMSINLFNGYMETHPEIDREIDFNLKKFENVNGKNLLFDSRLAWNFVPSAFSVYVSVDPEVAAKRVFEANRETERYASPEEAVRELSRRRASEILRYRTFYGLDITDMSNYDFVVDSTSLTPEEVADRIISEYESKR